MDLVASLLTVALVWGAVVVSPGPDFVVTAHHASARSRRGAMFVVAGIGTATLVWAAGAVAGLAVLFAHASWLVHVIRVVGAAYLVFQGVRMIWSARPHYTDSGNGASVATDRLPPASAWSAFRTGLVTDLANPKAAAFWTGLLSLALPPHASFAARLAVVAVAVAIATGWYACVAVFFSHDRIARAYRRLRRWIDRVAGAVMVGLGVRLGISS
jgi:threonine efflux protein